MEGFRDNRRKYQSNEYIQELGLNWMSFGARQYDPQIGRFLSIDPLAFSGGQQIFSPYAAMGNAPESMIDPNGTYAYLSDWGTTEKMARSMLNAMFGEKNYSVDPEDGKITILDPKSAATQLNIFMNSEWGYGVAAVTQMAVNAGWSILANFNNPETNVAVSFGKNAVGDNTVTDFSWSKNLAEVEINANGSSFTKYAGDVRVRQQISDKSRWASWDAAKRLGYMPPNPEAAGISLSGSMFAGTGGSYTINIGFVGDKMGIWKTIGGGFGTPDASFSLAVWTGEYQGRGAPTPETMAGDGDAFNGSVEVGPFGATGSFSRGFNEKGAAIWHIGGVGLSIGVPLAPIKASANYQRTVSEYYKK